jgi:hypothetical protein
MFLHALNIQYNIIYSTIGVFQVFFFCITGLRVIYVVYIREDVDFLDFIDHVYVELLLLSMHDLYF